MDRAMTGWWRRNALPLVALAVLAPATFGVIGYHEWDSYFSGRATQPITVPAGERVDFAGAEWGPAAMLPFPMAEAPADAQVVVVGFAVDAADAALLCEQPVLREIGGLQREWTRSSLSLPLGLEGVDVEGTCRSDRMDRQRVTTLFMLPLDAEGPFALDVDLADGDSRFVRFVVDLE
jgi:hypothetical protein